MTHNKPYLFKIPEKISLISFLAIFISGIVLAQQPVPFISPEIHKDNTVTFRFLAPNAKEVTLAGDCFTINHHSEPMKKDDQGLWSITVGALIPDIYSYSFVVDGIRILDQDNGWAKPGPSAIENMFLVPGGQAEFLMESNVPHGEVRIVNYQSSVLNKVKQMFIYFPPEYEANDKRYPVFYMLHEGRGNGDSWITMGRANLIMDNLIAQGKTKPMIIVMPTVWAMDIPVSHDRWKENSYLFSESLIKDIIPNIEQHYRVLKGRENRAIGGASYPNVLEDTFYSQMDMFNNVGFFSNKISPEGFKQYLEKYSGRITDQENAKRIKIWIGDGSNAPAYEDAQSVAKTLKEYGYNTTFYTVDGGIHEWPTFRRCFAAYSMHVFK